MRNVRLTGVGFSSRQSVQLTSTAHYSQAAARYLAVIGSGARRRVLSAQCAYVICAFCCGHTHTNTCDPSTCAGRNFAATKAALGFCGEIPESLVIVFAIYALLFSSPFTPKQTWFGGVHFIVVIKFHSATIYTTTQTLMMSLFITHLD